MQENLHHLKFPTCCICDCCSLSDWARLVPTPHLDANTMPYFEPELPYSTGKAKPMSTLRGEVLSPERGVFGFACGGHAEAANPKRISRIRPKPDQPKMKETGLGGPWCSSKNLRMPFGRAEAKYEGCPKCSPQDVGSRNCSEEFGEVYD